MPTSEACESCMTNSQVIDSRIGPYNTVRRRRKCCICGRRFTTYEYKETYVTPNLMNVLGKSANLVKLTLSLVEIAKALADKTEYLQTMLEELRHYEHSDSNVQKGDV